MRWISILCWLCVGQVCAQDFAAGLMPTINVSKKINEDISLVGSMQSRLQNYTESRWASSYVLTDYILFGSYKLASNQKFNIGFTFRESRNTPIYRISQHYNLIINGYRHRIGMRFAGDQTFRRNRTTVYRLRYRLTFEKPLSGEKVDTKEWYLKAGNEYLMAMSDNRPDYEIRFVPQLGFQLTDKQKLEFGLDYRLGDLATELEQDLWLRLTWYARL